MTAADRAAAVVARWVRFYTRQLPTEVAERRRAELASDLWEQRTHGRAAGGPGFSILRRMAAGAPADLRWRHEQLAVARGRQPEPGMRDGWRALARGWWLGLAGLVALSEVVLGISMTREAFPGATARGVAATAGGLLVLTGVALRRRLRVAGDLAVTAGALPAVSWWATTGPAALLSVAALVVIVAATSDAVDAQRPARARPSGDIDRTLLAASDRMLVESAVVFLALLLAHGLLWPGGVDVGIGGVVLILIGYIGLRRRRHRRKT
jgi:hypothetical protein